MSDHQIGDAPIEPGMREMMNDLARSLDQFFNGEARGTDRKVGFILMAFRFHAHEGRCNYISNTQREDVIVLLKEQLARFEGQSLQSGRG